VLTNDTAQSGFTLSITGVGSPLPNSLGAVTSVSGGVITFTPNGTAAGTVRFNYYVCDNGPTPLCDTASVLVTIKACAPIVVDTIYDTTLVNTPDTVCIGGYVHSTGAWHIASICDPANGTITSFDTGCFTYVPHTGYFGNDTFCIVVCDTTGCDTSRVVITVLDTLIKAVAEPCDLDTTSENKPITLDVLANDILPKATDTVVTLRSQPVHGTAEINPDKTVTYTPNTDYFGNEHFTYMVCAVTGSYQFCDTADICITVLPPCFIPNAFSPNGDGVNDNFEIPCNDNYPKATLRVYDRWGIEVWKSNGHYLNDFAGYNQGGVRLPDATYYAVYEYNDGVTKNVAKFVVIHR